MKDVYDDDPFPLSLCSVHFFGRLANAWDCFNSGVDPSGSAFQGSSLQELALVIAVSKVSPTCGRHGYPQAKGARICCSRRKQIPHAQHTNIDTVNSRAESKSQVKRLPRKQSSLHHHNNVPTQLQPPPAHPQYLFHTMSNPTLINLPPPPSDPITPSDVPYVSAVLLRLCHFTDPPL